MKKKTLDEEMTWQFLKEAWNKCPNCKAHWRFQHIHLYSEIFNDGQVWCDNCTSYLGMWDRLEHMVVSKNVPERKYAKEKLG